MRPTSFERVTSTPSHSSSRISRALSSQSGFKGENTLATATDWIPHRTNTAGRLAHRPLVEGHDRPAVVFVAPLDGEDLASHETSEILRPIHERRKRRARGKSDADRGHPRETPPFDHGVCEMRRADHDGADRASKVRATSRRASETARTMPDVTSSVVVVFTEARTSRPSMRTASVLVPPTSIPMVLTRTPIGSPGRSRTPSVPRARVLSRS